MNEVRALPLWYSLEWREVCKLIQKVGHSAGRVGCGKDRKWSSFVAKDLA